MVKNAQEDADGAWLDFCKHLTKGRPVPTGFKGNQLTLWSRIEKWAKRWPQDVRVLTLAYTDLGVIYIAHRRGSETLGMTVVIPRGVGMDYFFIRTPIEKADKVVHLLERLRQKGYPVWS